MTDVVLDASALLAFLRSEPGADAVRLLLAKASISAVNLTETYGTLVQYGKRLDNVRTQIGRLQLDVHPFDGDQAVVAASIVEPTQPLGLSLGDRACLALALSLGVPAITADKEWKKLSIGVRIVSIR